MDLLVGLEKLEKQQMIIIVLLGLEHGGSLEKDILEKYKEPCPEALVESALKNIKILEDNNFF